MNYYHLCFFAFCQFFYTPVGVDTEVALLNSISGLATDKWELAKNGDNVTVYTRQYAGAEIKEFKAITTVTAKMSSLTALIENINDYPSWQANIASAKLLKQVNQNEQYIYYTTDVPWPVTDRDIVIHSKKSVSSKGVVTYTLKSSPNYIKEKEEFLRIRDAKGGWQFIPKEGGKIKVVYQFYGDPAGSIPNWLINTFIVDGPHETLGKLRKLRKRVISK